MAKFAHFIETAEFNFAPLQCASNINFEWLRKKNTLQHLTELFYNQYKIPMFTLGLSCCGMPVQSEIASVWRTNIHKIKNFLHLTDTGVNGQIQNYKSEPLRNAHVRFMGADYQAVYNVTKNAARFQIILPAGDYQMEISATQYEPLVKQITVNHGEITELGVIRLSDYSLITGTSEVHAQGSASKLSSSSAKTTSISGFVLDLSNHPIEGAKVSIKHTLLHNITDKMGSYTINGVQNGDVTIAVEAAYHIDDERLLHLGQSGNPVAGVVFHLGENDHVWGMPRLLFIIVASILIIIAVVMCIMGTQYCLAKRSSRFDKHYYNFSMLPQKSKELFEDEEGETELFRSPIKSMF